MLTQAGRLLGIFKTCALVTATELGGGGRVSGGVYLRPRSASRLGAEGSYRKPSLQECPFPCNLCYLLLGLLLGWAITWKNLWSATGTSNICSLKDLLSRGRAGLA